MDKQKKLEILYLPCDLIFPEAPTVCELLKSDIRFKENKKVKTLESLDIDGKKTLIDLLEELRISKTEPYDSGAVMNFFRLDYFNTSYTFNILIDQKIRSITLDVVHFDNKEYDLIAACLTEYDFIIDRVKKTNKCKILDRCSAFRSHLKIDDIIKYAINNPKEK